MALWLKASVLLASTIIVFLTFFVVPSVAKDLAEEKTYYAYLSTPFVVFVWVSVIPAAAAVPLSWAIFSEMGRDNSFCEKNARYLKYISLLSLFIAAYYFIGIVLLLIAHLLYVPILICAAVIISICFLVSVSCAALSHLVMKAWLIKAENDLTV
ncbi:MAG: DUF2975 domain-containing protein [Eubacteriaceae bacterium]|nr:DUF2975 domain-containing protein [Eubacteriaceae bacterium]